MGLDLSAVNKDYGYKKVWYDARTDEQVKKTDEVTEEKGYYYEWEELETNETFSDASIGYFGFMDFRSDIAKHFGLEDYYKWLQTFGHYFFEEKTYDLILTKDNASKEDLSNPKFKVYIAKMELMRKEPYFDLLPLLLHSDCDGELSFKAVETIYPKVKDFLQPLIDSKTKKYGYIGRDYEWFEQDFLYVLEEVIKNKGKLYFH